MDLKEILELKQKYAATWDLSHNSTRLCKSISFKNFKKPYELFIEIGKLAEEKKHHPDFKIGWGYLEIEITTHSLKNLTINDFELAHQIDEFLAVQKIG